MATSPFTRRRTLVLALVFGAVAGVLLLWSAIDVRERAGELVAEPARGGTPAAATVRLTAQEQAFYDVLAPRLLALTAETRRLAELGQARSRNLLELQARATRVERTAAEIEALLDRGEPPAVFADAVERCRVGIATIRSGMADARSAIARFDWDGVAAGLERFAAGSTQLDLAYDSLSAAAGATPVARASPETDLRSTRTAQERPGKEST